MKAKVVEKKDFKLLKTIKLEDVNILIFCGC